MFFTSPNGVKCALEQGFSILKYKVGAVAPGTAMALRKFGIIPDFEGREDENTEETAARFGSILSDERVLIMAPKRSSGTVQKALQKNQYAVIDVYETRGESIRVQHFEHVVFSSPSNVRSFLKTNQPPANVVAYGSSTAAELNKYAIFSTESRGYQTKNILESILQLPL